MRNQIARFTGLIILTAMALAVAAMVVTSGWRPDGLPENHKYADADLVPVSVIEVRPELVEITDSYSGMVRPLERYSLGFEIAGRVVPLEDGRFPDEGHRVSQGQVLAKLDDRAFNSQLQEALAQLEHAKAQIEQANAQIEEAHARQRKAISDLARGEGLKARGPGAIAEAEYQGYVTAVAVAKAQVAVAGAQLTAAVAGRETANARIPIARKNVEDTTLLSPVDGVISKRLVNPGESVNPHQAIMEVIQAERGSGQVAVLLVVGVPEAFVSEIRPGLPVRVELLARDRFRRERPCGQGRVYRVAEAADQTTGLFEVEVSLPNRDGCWKPGLIGLAHIVLNEVRGYRIPMTSAVFREKEAYLFTVDEQGKAHRLDLQSWIEQGPDLIVPDLPANRRTVVSRGQRRLVDGRQVTIVKLPDEGPSGPSPSPAIRSPASVAESPRPASVRD